MKITELISFNHYHHYNAVVLICILVEVLNVYISITIVLYDFKFLFVDKSDFSHIEMICFYWYK